MSEENQLFADEEWTKTSYRHDPIWGEVENHIAAVVERTKHHQDMHPDPELLEYISASEIWECIVQRQVALALYVNIHDKFQGDSAMLKRMTKNQQSHWNFMLLGTSRPPRPMKDMKRTAFFGRAEQVVTIHFLCKCLKRLRLQGIEFDWQTFSDAMAEGTRWRVMASPMRNPQRAEWVKKYGEARPSLDYPAPWKIAEEFHNEARPVKPTKRKMWVQTNGEDVMADYQYNQEVRACTVQNDGIFLIPADGEPMIEGKFFSAERKLWLLQGMSEPDGLRELDDPSVNRERFKDILRAAIQQSVEAEQRVKELEMQVKGLKEDLGNVTADFKLEHERRMFLTRRLEGIGMLTQFSNRDRAEMKHKAQMDPSKEKKKG